MIGSQMDFNLLGVPLSIKGTYIVEGWGKTDLGKRKQQEPKTVDKAPRITDDKGSPKKQRTDAYDGSKIPVHAVIKSKITALLPDRFQMKKLAAACGITDLAHIFPEAPKLCLHAAFRGFCPFHQKCKKDHDNSVITDKMAENAVHMFEPFIKDPTILAEGK